MSGEAAGRDPDALGGPERLKSISLQLFGKLLGQRTGSPCLVVGI